MKVGVLVVPISVSIDDESTPSDTVIEIRLYIDPDMLSTSRFFRPAPLYGRLPTVFAVRG